MRSERTVLWGKSQATGAKYCRILQIQTSKAISSEFSIIRMQLQWGGTNVVGLRSDPIFDGLVSQARLPPRESLARETIDEWACRKVNGP